jgi:hypothetical protein
MKKILLLTSLLLVLVINTSAQKKTENKLGLAFSLAYNHGVSYGIGINKTTDSGKNWYFGVAYTDAFDVKAYRHDNETYTADVEVASLELLAPIFNKFSIGASFGRTIGHSYERAYLDLIKREEYVIERKLHYGFYAGLNIAYTFNNKVSIVLGGNVFGNNLGIIYIL